MDINEKASKYAESKANEGITKMIADAYLEGYKEGYAAREQEIPMEIRDRKTKYIDLGLPSGTLWATDYEKQDGEVLYLPYCEARTMKIPTEEQLRELYEKCRWHKKFNHKPEIESMYCIGPNGRKLSFTLPGIIKTDEKEEPTIIRFWIRNNNDKEGTKAARIHTFSCLSSDTEEVFSGYGLAVRLVQ